MEGVVETRLCRKNLLTTCFFYVLNMIMQDANPVSVYACGERYQNEAAEFGELACVYLWNINYVVQSTCVYPPSFAETGS